MSDYDIGIEYFLWNNPKGNKHDREIALEYHALTNRYMTAWLERVFPEDRHLTKIDAETYIRYIRSWGHRLYKKLNKNIRDNNEYNND